MIVYPRCSLDKAIQDDSWSAIFKPPQNESHDEKQARIAQQQEAARISREIDDAIEKSRKQLEKRKKAVKVLLLGASPAPPPAPPHVRPTGQAESGKSTMLRSRSLPPRHPPHSPSAQTFSWPFVRPTSTARFRYGRSSSSSISSGLSHRPSVRFSPHSSTAPSRGCFPSSKTSLSVLSLVPISAAQLLLPPYVRPLATNPPPLTLPRAQAPHLHPATSFRPRPPSSHPHPGRALSSSDTTLLTPP
jgi:hypothetical protein